MNSQKTLTLPAIEVRQGSTKLLLTRMRAADLADFTRVDPFDGTKDYSDPTQGYQRQAEEPRVKKLANYLRRESEEGGQVRMPTSILLSGRGSDIVLSPHGTITLKSNTKLPLIDGQHRKLGFLYAIDKKQLVQFADFEVPVVILQNIDKVGEMKQFRAVNGEQKSVRTDLVNMILTQLVENVGEEAVDPKDHWKVAASHVIKKLNEDEDGPWYDRIVMPDQKAYSKDEQAVDPSMRHRRIARATSFISSLKPIDNYLVEMESTRPSLDKRVELLYETVNDFWRALRELNPDCFEDADDYVMLKTPGIFALHQLMLPVMKDMVFGKRDRTQTEFVHMLSHCTELSDPSYWSVGSEDEDRGDAAKYGSMKGFAELGSLLYESLRS